MPPRTICRWRRNSNQTASGTPGAIHIEIKDGPNGPISYVLILNPFPVLKEHYAKRNIDAKSYNALLERMIETGGSELQEEEEEASSTASTAAPPPPSPSSAAPA
jgi:hypothetical protein